MGRSVGRRVSPKHLLSSGVGHRQFVEHHRCRQNDLGRAAIKPFSLFLSSAVAAEFIKSYILWKLIPNLRQRHKLAERFHGRLQGQQDHLSH